ncbi:septation protein SepH [Streptomonospora wellingtoniae]|uniref:Septation protein SepH n=1 Tax=Streptomonospora wellingtoniae TaxID=3075544 RepID=A0ABU2KUZ6_9ACTN|nr:septation protein SepH [Streptomonospora sp. DSM 45055]MDT0302992.1 septation protein SepH [Streptomonospora sp. DSM 45055]
MQELRLAAVSEDGTYLVLASAGRGTRFMLPVDDRLRAAVRGQFSRLGQYEIEVENPLRPKEIQARIRSGETAEAISDLSGIPIERVRWFESPVLQEREYVAQQAQRASVRRQGETAPGPTLGDLITDRIGAHQLETGDAAWDSWKREDNTWQLKLVFLVTGEERVAHWVYEPRRRSVTPADDEAMRFLTREADEPLDLGPGSANVTPFVPRRQGHAPEPVRPEPLRSEPARPEPAQPEPGRREAPLPTDPPREEDPPAPAPPAAPRRPAAGRARITTDDVIPGERAAPPEPTAPQRREERRAPAPEPPAETTAASAGEPEHPGRPERAERPAAGRASVLDAEPPAAQGQASGPARAAEPAPSAEQDERQDHAPARHQEPPVSAAAAGTGSPGGGSSPRRKGRGRRASVPSWDEIMFGSKKSD